MNERVLNPEEISVDIEDNFDDIELEILNLFQPLPQDDIDLDYYLNILSKLTYLQNSINTNNLEDKYDELQNILRELIIPDEFLNLVIKFGDTDTFLSNDSILKKYFIDIKDKIPNDDRISYLRQFISNELKDKVIINIDQFGFVIGQIYFEPIKFVNRLKELYRKINELFSIDIKQYKANMEIVNGNLKEALKSLYYYLNTKRNNPYKYTYTFNIKPSANMPTTNYIMPQGTTIEVEHNLFGDLFMLRSEIPHDFDKIKNIDLYKKIIKLSIYEYAFNNFSNDEKLLNIIENILKINLDEERSGISVLELIYLSGIPLIKQTKNKLYIEVEENENDSCIFPSIFNKKYVQVVSDADSQGNKYFSQVENLIPESENEYPFLKFDAGSAPTFYSFRDQIEREKELERLKTKDDNNSEEGYPPPPQIDVKSLDGNTYLKIMNTSVANKYLYSVRFNNPYENIQANDNDYLEIERIVNLLNSDTENLKLINKDNTKEDNNEEYNTKEVSKLTSSKQTDEPKAGPTTISEKIPNSAASITAVTTIVNRVLRNLYIISGTKENNIPEEEISHVLLQLFLTEQVNLYEEYVNEISKNRYNEIFTKKTLTDKKAPENKNQNPIQNQEYTTKRKRDNNDSNSKNKNTKPRKQQDSKIIAGFICKLLLNVISIKSLGDLVPYYVTLIQIMANKAKLPPTYELDERALTNYFTTKANLVNDFFGALGSGDYSLIQSPLINVNFLNQNGIIDDTLKKEIDNTEIVSCVHIKNSDITLPITKKEKDIYILMSCIESGGCNLVHKDKGTNIINKYFGDELIKSLTEYSSYVDFMNINENIENIDTLNSEIYAMDKYITISEAEPGATFIENIDSLLTNLSTILDKPDNSQQNKLITNILKYNVEKLNNFRNNFDNFIDIIVELNAIINTMNVQQFFIDLDTVSKPIISENNDSNPYINTDKLGAPDTNNVFAETDRVNIMINNPNIYFLCEYIIRNLNYKLLSETATAIETAKGGETKKSSKFKITKKQNKNNKNNKKRTRKYLR
jgi:hypothetical protein